MAAASDPAPAAGTAARPSLDSQSSASTTSLVFERLDEKNEADSRRAGRPSRTNRYNDDENRQGLDDLDDDDPLKEQDGHDDLETGPFLPAGKAGLRRKAGMERSLRTCLIVLGLLFAGGWVAALFVFVSNKSYQHPSKVDHDPDATQRGSGKPITLDQVQSGYWRAESHEITWIAGPDGEDGLLMEQGAAGKDWLVVEDVRASSGDNNTNGMLVGTVAQSRTLVKSSSIHYGGRQMWPSSRLWPSPDMKKVLLTTDYESNWRYSFTALYWILDVATQTVEPLDPENAGGRVQLASWSPQSDAIVFTRDNNMFLRRLSSKKVKAITTDGGSELFYGAPDWVYEEEVLGGNSATWWSADGKYVAFLRTNETGVPEYPVQYFVSRPSGKSPAPGEESYPEVRQIKYPKAGAHNPIVDLQFYDVARGDVFTIDISDGFADEDRLVTTVVWAGKHVLVKETNRVSDIMRVVLVDVAGRSGKTVNTIDVGKIDGGWFEISQKTQYIPADPNNGRLFDGYVDTVISENRDHLAYFTPLDNPKPLMLTQGPWEVVEAPSAVDLKNNLVYFVATKESPIQRHVYSVKLDGTGLKAITDTSAEGYYDMSFSSGAGFGLLTYAGPSIPWQKVVSTPSNPTGAYERVVEKNEELAEQARKHELPLKVYGTLELADGVTVNYVERRPPHFDEKKKYPVLFYQYSGPGSQTVSKRFGVDWQSYVAAGLGYICVTVDGRGTGFMGRAHRVPVRGQLGRWEAHDQIAAARQFGERAYVDETRLAIWGWSYGGFTTLKTLEADAGRTFRYGMAVAPVTDWRFYDSVYTERYMRTPQVNGAGYDGSAVRNATALGQNVRFLLLHGVADDNVHMQNSLTLLDLLDMAGVENYDVHVFPDSDHGIYFHNANRIVYDKLTNWLVNAFNGEWLKVADPKPIS